MRRAALVLLLLLIGGSPAGADDPQPLPPWEPPDPATLPDDSVGRTIRYGHDLIANTAFVGPFPPEQHRVGPWGPIANGRRRTPRRCGPRSREAKRLRRELLRRTAS